MYFVVNWRASRFFLTVLLKKTSCLSFRCSALVCGASRRVNFRVFVWNISLSVLTG